MNIKLPLKKPLWLWWLVIAAALVSLKGKKDPNVFSCRNEPKINMMIIVFINDVPRYLLLGIASIKIIACALCFAVQYLCYSKVRCLLYNIEKKCATIAQCTFDPLILLLSKAHKGTLDTVFFLGSDGSRCSRCLLVDK